MFKGDNMDGIILINKPSGMTSHDVVNKLRKILKTKKVGHCGTLDPDATGVLVVCVNKATKVLQFLTSDSKEYIATLSLGTSTDTYDASGKVLEKKEYSSLDKQVIIDCFNKLYEYARNGEEVEIPTREVEINYLEIMDIKDNLIKFKVGCSKGTYIRSLCFDLAKALGYPGHMQDLIRTKSGNFSIEKCYTLEQIENGDFEYLSLEEALNSYRKIVIEDEKIVYHGKKIKSDINEQVVICNKNNQVLAMYGPDGNGYLKNIRGLW